MRERYTHIYMHACMHMLDVIYRFVVECIYIGSDVLVCYRMYIDWKWCIGLLWKMCKICVCVGDNI